MLLAKFRHLTRAGLNLSRPPRSVGADIMKYSRIDEMLLKFHGIWSIGNTSNEGNYYSPTLEIFAEPIGIFRTSAKAKTLSVAKISEYLFAIFCGFILIVVMNSGSD